MRFLSYSAGSNKITMATTKPRRKILEATRFNQREDIKKQQFLGLFM